VSYNLGGTEPTVTDADLVLGYLDPGFFLGGEMELAIDPAREALGVLGKPMGLSAEETAGAVHRVVNENMASAARMHAIERGRDIRKYTLVATGGAGPVHAWGVAQALGIQQIVLPPRAGVASAFGMLTAPTSFEFARSIPSTVADTDWSEVNSAIELMLRTGRSQLQESGVSETDVSISADVRYQGQGESITVPLGSGLPRDASTHVVERFKEEYLRLYGSSPTDVEPEILTWRLRISGPRPEPDIAARLGKGDALRGYRKMWFPNEGYVEGAVYDRYALTPGLEFEGPGVVEERESTMVIGPKGKGLVTAGGNVEVSIHG
jgi:N-methylhydantoinase A